MWTGVPEWRLPRDVIMEEVEQITDLGIEHSLQHRSRQGHHAQRSRRQLRRGGASRPVARSPQELGVPGEELDGVVSGLQFLEDVNLGQKDVWVGKRVVTVGGGFTSMDCVRTVLRMGAERSVMTYRRIDPGDPGRRARARRSRDRRRRDHVHGRPDPRHRRRQRQRDRHRDGHATSSARRTPRAAAGPSRSPGSEFVIDCDMVLVAIGQRQDNRFLGDMLPKTRPPRRAVARPEPADRAAECLGGRRLRHQSDQLHLLDRRRQARGRVDRPGTARRQAEDQGNGDHPRPDRVHLHAEPAALRRHRRVVA